MMGLRSLGSDATTLLTGAGVKALFSGRQAKPAKAPGRGRGRPSRETSERRNQELLERALDLFLENGFEATTIEAISNAIGMSRRTIYDRYGDKETLFRAALQLAIDQWIVPVAQLRDAECEDLEETLHRIARLWVANITKPSGMRLVRIANSEVFHRPDVALYLLDRTTHETVGYLIDLFNRRLRPEIAARDAERAAIAFMLLVVQGAAQLTTWGKMVGWDFEAQISYQIRLFLHGAIASSTVIDERSADT